ncbi:hypothetical protein fugu_007161 [Takifugu bimaculatus]|uniref:protein-tyrosine-phosphatase n=1 Tax=Takifugu bimaculatus TaxID=433685 RepID=A0A4Z2B3K6_9TELE|nr:hypothetical protein fugu_007161 [Takifugu bimaculatus]
MRVQTFSRVQILQQFSSRCQELAANDNRGFKQEFEELSDVGKDLPTRVGDSEANRDKNRYPYILPYDHCRVRLSVQNSLPHSDYINANFVPGGGSERDFICTQGPLQNTLVDFWRMVWEQNVRVIVMVTALRHKDTRDCLTSRMITQYYYPSWPDRGVPKQPSSLCTYTEHVRQDLEASPRLGPAVVHCSAGVGRSGTFVTLLWLMQLCVRGIRPNIRAAVEDLRLHRMWMVQNLDQYIFVHQCLLHWLFWRTAACNQPVPRTSTNNHVQFEASSSRTEGGGSGRRRRRSRTRHQHGQTPPSDQPQSRVQQILNPGNLLRRLLPSSSLFNSDSHPS